MLYLHSFMILLLVIALEKNGEAMTLQGSLNGLYHSNGAIDTQGDCTTEPGANATVVSGDRIVLKPGFRANQLSSFSAKVAEVADVDQDGLPDWWEMYYFNDLNNDGRADPDNDSLSNLQEYYQGTNPHYQDDMPTPALYENADFAYDEDDQQGGGGLLSHTVRILNGNVTEQRQDIRMPSPKAGNSSLLK